MDIMWSGLFAMFGWLWFYFFIRQILFNFMTAYPLIKKMNAADKDLIAVGASRYTAVSVIVSTLFSVIIAVVIIIFCALYLKISFFVGAVVAAFMFIPRLSYKKRDMFDTFCGSYYRFVPDDELRTAMYNKKPSQMKVRLHAMGVDTDFIPKFDK